MKGIAAVRFTWSSEAGRPEAEKTLEVYLAEAAAAGYDAVECHAPGLAKLTRKNKLKVCGTYVGGMFHGRWAEVKAEDTVLAAAREVAELGGDYLAVNCDPKGDWRHRVPKSDEDLKHQGANLSRLAAEVAPLGLRVAMHNHANRNDLHLGDLRSVTEFADEAVGVCLDTGWSLTSGDEPVARARELGRRVTAVHLRNQVGERPTEWLGEGDIDMAAFLAVLKENGYDGWLTTELWHREDVPRTCSLLDNQKRTVKLLRELWAA